jgi:hypothetical protein
MKNQHLVCVFLVALVTGCSKLSSPKVTQDEVKLVAIQVSASQSEYVSRFSGTSVKLTGRPVTQSAREFIAIVDGHRVTLVGLDGKRLSEYNLHDVFRRLSPSDDPRVIGMNLSRPVLYAIVTRRERSNAIKSQSGWIYTNWELIGFDTDTSSSVVILALQDLVGSGIKEVGLPEADYSFVNVVGDGDHVYVSVPSKTVVTTSGYYRPFTVRIHVPTRKLTAIGYGGVIGIFDGKVLMTEELFNSRPGARAYLWSPVRKAVDLGTVAGICATPSLIGLVRLNVDHMEVRDIADPTKVVTRIPVEASNLFEMRYGLVGALKPKEQSN